MIRMIGLLFSLAALAAALATMLFFGRFLANDALTLSLAETLVAIGLIVGFAVAATTWTIRRDV